MANMVDSACRAVMAVVARCLSIGGKIAAALSRAVAFAARRADLGGSALTSRLPLVRQQLLDPTVQLRGQPGEHVLEIRPRLVPIELGRLRRAPNYAEWACLLR